VPPKLSFTRTGNCSPLQNSARCTRKRRPLARPAGRWIAQAYNTGPRLFQPVLRGGAFVRTASGVSGIPLRSGRTACFVRDGAFAIDRTGSRCHRKMHGAGFFERNVADIFRRKIDLLAQGFQRLFQLAFGLERGLGTAVCPAFVASLGLFVAGVARREPRGAIMPLVTVGRPANGTCQMPAWRPALQSAAI